MADDEAGVRVSPRSEDERERARREREARRAERANRAVSADRPHARERVDAALERSRSRRAAAAPPPAQPRNGDTPGPAPARRRRGRILLPFVIALALIAIAAAWFLSSLYQPGKGDGSGRVHVTIPRGGSLGVIADRLDAAGVISKPFFFKLRTRVAGHANDLKPGAYVMKKDMAYTA